MPTQKCCTWNFFFFAPTPQVCCLFILSNPVQMLLPLEATFLPNSPSFSVPQVIHSLVLPLNLLQTIFITSVSPASGSSQAVLCYGHLWQSSKAYGSFEVIRSFSE